MEILLQVYVVADTCNVSDAGHTSQAHTWVSQVISKAHSAVETAAVIETFAEALLSKVAVGDGVVVAARSFVDAKD